MDDKTVLTKSGLSELMSELTERKSVTRIKIADDIDKARQQGDLSENAAYSSALESKEFNENRIKKIEGIINNSVVKSKKSGSIISIGSKVKIQNIASNTEQSFELVGDNEADSTKGRISISSPIGDALKGMKKGDRIKVPLPVGEIEFKIISVD
ncbi:MAG: transcription elongation factor GreA [Candidatus Dojkabacteria bacterium]